MASEYDARCLRCISGIAMVVVTMKSHGYLSRQTVVSDDFSVVFKDIRDGLIYYSKLAQNKNGIYNSGSIPLVGIHIVL